MSEETAIIYYAFVLHLTIFLCYKTDFLLLCLFLVVKVQTFCMLIIRMFLHPTSILFNFLISAFLFANFVYYLGLYVDVSECGYVCVCVLLDVYVCSYDPCVGVSCTDVNMRQS